MPEREDNTKVAIYWDFENLHAILANIRNGESWYWNNRYTPQPKFLELRPIIEYAASLGDIIIHRAYGNWQWFAEYRDDLNIAGIDLIQLFPRGAGMKNSADIRMSLDALSDVNSYQHISHVVIVTSDSDYISLAQKIKQAGKMICGVGVDGNSNKYLVASCNEFKFYQNLVKSAEEPNVGVYQTQSPIRNETENSNGKIEGGEPVVVGTPTEQAMQNVLMRAMHQLV